MNWYLTLNIHQRINLKESSKRICGIDWQSLCSFFGIYESLNLLELKLIREGFDLNIKEIK